MILEIEISFYSHRLINFWRSTLTVLSVVYLLIPTSNHNVPAPSYDMRRLYIFWFLHQTTTLNWILLVCNSCISFDSYIKPQPAFVRTAKVVSCISFDSYIKPQLQLHVSEFKIVVYLLIPTSNHNVCLISLGIELLYIFWFLHQTTTINGFYYHVLQLYIFWFLHQTTTAGGLGRWRR